MNAERVIITITKLGNTARRNATRPAFLPVKLSHIGGQEFEASLTDYRRVNSSPSQAREVVDMDMLSGNDRTAELSNYLTVLSYQMTGWEIA